MGEQTPIQTSKDQSQSPPHQSDSQPEPNATSLPQPTPVIEPSTDLPQTTSNPSKIPIRPQKIRKLSSDASSVVDSSGEAKSPLLITNSDSPTPSTITPISTTIITTTTTRSKRKNPSQAAGAFPRIIKPLTAEGEIDLALRHLRSVDPLVADLMETLPPPTFETHPPPFLALTKSILYQQLAYKAGASIYTRFVSLCGGEDNVQPDTVLSLTAQQLKQIGVSARKASYLYDLASKYNNGILSDEMVVKMDDRSLFTMLSMVKGIGSWSVHMFMIFSLHRPDVLPVSDLGVRKGVQILYGLEELPRPSQMEQLCEKWKPYRSVGAWYMWRLSERKGNSTAAAATLEGSVQPLQTIGPPQEAPQQHQLQLLESINGMPNFGACIWS